MSKKQTTVILFFLLLGQMSLAAQKNRIQFQDNEQVYDKETLKEAMLVLLRSKAITLEPEYGTRINPNLINEMRRDGLIERADAVTSSVCIDPIGK